MNKIKEAFNTIKASEELKENTKQYLYNNVYNKQKKNYRYALALISIFVLFFTITTYITPVAAISIDSNASIQIEVNKFNRVISVSTYDNTNNLIQSLNLKHMDYNTAVDMIINELEHEGLISDSSYLNIAISTKDNTMSSHFLDNIEDEYGGKYQYLNCMTYDTTNQNNAKQHHMSIGKYQEILELQKENPNITIDEFKGMSMQEIKEHYHNENGKHKGKKH